MIATVLAALAASLALGTAFTLSAWALADAVPSVEAFSDKLAAALCACADCDAAAADRAAARRNGGAL